MRDSELFAELGKLSSELGATVGPNHAGPARHVKPSFQSVDHCCSQSRRQLRKKRIPTSL